MLRKTCSRCKEEKEVSYFCKDKSSKDGTHHRCKPCDVDSKRGKIRVRPANNNELARVYYRKRRTQALLYYKEWYKKNKKRKLAHGIVSRTVKLKLLEKTKCESCGNIKTFAHHCDYNKPLDVMWLCRSCHSRWHISNQPIL